MAAQRPIHPLSDPAQGPIAGEDVLASMLQWSSEVAGRPGSLAGLIELNWIARSDLSYIDDRVAGERRQPLFSLTVEQARAMLVALEQQDLAPKMIFFTGADAAGHPQLGDFLELVRQRGIAQVGLQCSGLRLAHDDDLLELLVRQRPLLFVEFDGFDETASLILHGRRDLPFEARRGLDRLAAAGLPTALLASVIRGVNLQEVGAIAAFGFKHPAVFSVIFRPFPPRPDRLGAGASGHVSAAGLMAALEQQSNGLVRQDVFVPALCCRPERHFYAQVPYPGPNVSAPAGQPLIPLSSNTGCAAPGGTPCFWLGVHEFMTPWSKDLGRAQRCPLVIMTPDGRTIPYCLYNALEE